MSEPETHNEESPAKRRLEALAATLGALLVAGTLGVILWDEWRGSGRPPFVVVQAGAVRQGPGGFVLEVAADNRGDQAAAQVVVEGELRRGEAVVARSETTFDYVPSHSHREGGLFFKEDPRQFQVEVRALGFVDP